MPTLVRTARYTDIIFLRKAVLINQILPVGHPHIGNVTIFIYIITRSEEVFRCRQVFASRSIVSATRQGRIFPSPGIRQLAIRFITIFIIIKHLFVLIIGISECVEHIHTFRYLRECKVGTEFHLFISLLTSFGGYDNNPVRPTGTIYGSRGSIFQDINTLNVVRIDKCQWV